MWSSGEILDLLGLSEHKDRLPSELALVARRRVGLARALSCGPRMLLLDEPAAGLGRDEVGELAAVLTAVARAGVGVLLVEHDTELVFDVCDRILVLDAGTLLADGTPEEVRLDPAVAHAYLGTRSESEVLPAPVRAPPNRAEQGERPILEVVDLHVRYGDIEAVSGIDFTVAEGEIVLLVGPNGSGKTTTTLACAGLLAAHSGAVMFRGDPVDSARPHRNVRAGLGLVPEDRALFPGLTVRQHLELVSRRCGHEYVTVLEVFPQLAGLLDQPAGLLSGGEQQMLAIGRAVLAQPRLLIIDEMSQGLAPMIVVVLFKALRQLVRDTALSVLLVDQHVDSALPLAAAVHVMRRGEIVASRTRAQGPLQYDEIRAFYFGTRAADVPKEP